MNLSEIIDQTRITNGHTKVWVAEQTGIKYKTFIDKLKRDSFDGVELLKIAKVLNIDLEKLKGKI